jgi:hypothetical protein
MFLASAKMNDTLLEFSYLSARFKLETLQSVLQILLLTFELQLITLRLLFNFPQLTLLVISVHSSIVSNDALIISIVLFSLFSL